MGHWLGFNASTTVGTGLIPRQGTKIPHAVQRGQKKKQINKSGKIFKAIIETHF